MIIVQVGANKGNTDNDPVWKLVNENLPESLSWKLIFIEPNKKALAILTENYRNIGFTYPNILTYNYAVSDKTQYLTLYVDNDVPGNEGSQHASLSRSHLNKLGHDDSVITEMPVYGHKLNAFLIGEKPIDYLQIDTEGWDGKILLGADLNSYKIKKIQFEYCHLEYEECRAVVKKLVDHGYKYVSKTHEDITFELVEPTP